MCIQYKIWQRVGIVSYHIAIFGALSYHIHCFPPWPYRTITRLLNSSVFLQWLALQSQHEGTTTPFLRNLMVDKKGGYPRWISEFSFLQCFDTIYKKGIWITETCVTCCNQKFSVRTSGRRQLKRKQLCVQLKDGHCNGSDVQITFFVKYHILHYISMYLYSCCIQLSSRMIYLYLTKYYKIHCIVQAYIVNISSTS